MSYELQLSPSEREIIAAVCKFANMPKIKSVAQVERCFKNVKELDKGLMLIDFTAELIQRTKNPADLPVHYYADLQFDVSVWLARIALSNRGKRVVAAEIAPEVMRVRTVTEFANDELNDIRYFESVRAVCAFAVALILSKHRDLAKRLKLCRWSKCEHPFNFSLTVNPKGGHLPEYCPGHKGKRSRSEEQKERRRKEKAKRLKDEQSNSKPTRKKS